MEAVFQSILHNAANVFMMVRQDGRQALVYGNAPEIIAMGLYSG